MHIRQLPICLNLSIFFTFSVYFDIIKRFQADEYEQMLINEQIKWLRQYFIFSVTLNFMKSKPPKCTFNI